MKIRDCILLATFPVLFGAAGVALGYAITPEGSPIFLLQRLCVLTFGSVAGVLGVYLALVAVFNLESRAERFGRD